VRCALLYRTSLRSLCARVCDAWLGDERVRLQPYLRLSSSDGSGSSPGTVTRRQFALAMARLLPKSGVMPRGASVLDERLLALFDQLARATTGADAGGKGGESESKAGDQAAATVDLKALMAGQQHVSCDVLASGAVLSRSCSVHSGVQ
jgi:hypothetical protein